MEDRPSRKSLVVAGVALILLGLLTGFILPHAKLPRVAMATHVEGVLGGMLLILVGGVVWPFLKWGGRAGKIVTGMLVYSAYANWFFLLLAALLGTGKMLPIAAPGVRGGAVAEAMVAAGLVSSALALVAAFVAMLVRLVKDPARTN